MCDNNFIYTCPKCNGIGLYNKFSCDRCHGSGKLDWIEYIKGKKPDAYWSAFWDLYES